MTVHTKLTKKDYINASLTVMFSRPFVRYFLVIIFLIALINTVSGISNGANPLSGILPPLIILILYSSFVYFSVGKAYTSNARASESMEYSFEEGNLIIKGESFKSELSWDKVLKVTQTKNWLLVWQNRQIANAIPKRDIPAGLPAGLKAILAKNGVKNNL